MRTNQSAFNDKKAYRASGARDIEMAPLITTQQPRSCIRSCELPWPIRQKDRIMLNRTEELYEVTEIEPDSIGNMIEVSVNQLGRRYQFESIQANRLKGIR